MFGDSRVPPRIWARLKVTDSGCWEWQGATRGKGDHQYGTVSYDSRQVSVHRLIYHLLVAPVQQDTVRGGGGSREHIHHVCSNTRCANPAHLEALSVLDHIGEWHRKKTHCPQGHEYTPSNTYIRKEGHRQCRVCMTEAQRRHRAKKRAA